MARLSPDDEAWNLLFDDSQLSKKRSDAEKKYEDLSSNQIKALRTRCKSDLFFLANGPLEYGLLSESFHGHYYRWLQGTWGSRYRMTLFARDHYKSTSNTIADSIQMALPNKGLNGDPINPHWPYCLGSNIKLLLGHEVRDTASDFLFEILQAFREKPLMLALFPELIPMRNVQRMNKYEVELPRTEFHKEATFSTIGVGGAAQGRHYHWLKLDDLVGEDARDSETVMRKVLMWFDNVNALLTRLKFDGWDLIGTRWAASDVYSHACKMYGVNIPKSILNAYEGRDIEKMENGELLVYARGALESINGVETPVFPEEFTLKDLNRIRRNPKVWSAQYANNPRAGELTRLDPNWLKYYHNGPRGKLIAFEGEDRGTTEVNVKHLDRLIMIDPSVGETSDADETGFIVTGTDRHMRIFILEAYRKRLKAPDLMDELIRLYTKWNPRLISIEEVVFSAVLKYWFEEKCNKLGIYPSIYPYKPGNKRSKHGRIERLSNYGAGGQIYILEGMHQLRDEWEWFPLGEADHLLDALAQGPEIWSASIINEAADMENAVKLVEEERSDLTGYSVI